jgi:hypothetical protein
MQNTTGNLDHKASLAYASKVAIAQANAAMGARAVTLTSVARTKPADSRAIYKSVTGNQSQSGQTPTNHEWFLQSRNLRLHSAMLLLMYAAYREKHEPLPDAHGIAFTLSYSNYLGVCRGEALISPERFALLAGNGFSIGWRDIPRGGASKFPHDNLKVMRCRKCRLPHLIEAHYVRHTCTECLA